LFQKFGRYILLEKIATGGMAEIWIAKQIGVDGFEKLIVIKKILEKFSENKKFAKMFIEEAKVASKLAHPNIAQIYDLGNHNNIYYIAMEYIHGYDILSIIKKGVITNNILPMNYSIKIISTAASALYYANNFRDVNAEKLNIVHRDISPQNILVSYHGITKIVDFGIAKANSSSEETQVGILKGKYPYMSPEQILGKKLDARSDIFSLGIILYEITVGKRLFKAKNELKTFKLITEERIIPPIEIHPNFPKKLNDIIMKALSKKRSERYNSAKEFSNALDNSLIELNINITTMKISNYLKRLFKEDIVNRILINKQLFNDANDFLEAELKNNPKYQNLNSINEFAFNTHTYTGDQRIIKRTSGKDEFIDDEIIADAEIEKQVVIPPKKKTKAIITTVFLIILIYSGVFGLLFKSTVDEYNSLLIKSVKKNSQLELPESPTKELKKKLKSICKKNSISCNKKDLEIIHAEYKLKLSIKYKVEKKLFALIPIKITFEKSYEEKTIQKEAKNKKLEKKTQIGVKEKVKDKTIIEDPQVIVQDKVKIKLKKKKTLRK